MSWGRTIFIVFSALFLASGTATNLFAQTRQSELAGEANKADEQKNYSLAIEKYSQLVAGGVRNAKIYYNLGNAYFRNRQLGQAILYYERAYRLSPADEDLIYNLNYVRSQIKEAPLDFWERLYNSVNLNTLTLIVSVFSFIFFAFLTFFIFKRGKFLFWVSLVSGVILLLLAVWWGGRLYFQEMVKSAIVVDNAAEVRNGPGEDFSIGFTVPEGKKVIILNGQDSWCEIGLKKEGLKGWLLKKQVEQI